MKVIDSTLDVDYRACTSLPIKDIHTGEIFCVVNIYGWTDADVPIRPSDPPPMVKAFERLGLDPKRYACFLTTDGVTENYHADRPLSRRAQSPRGRND